MKEYKKMALQGCLTLIVFLAVVGLALYGLYGLYELIANLIK